MERRLDRARIYLSDDGNPLCLICSIEELTRRDVDGLCLACRAGVAHGLYRVNWLTDDCGDSYRVVCFATVAEHPLGCEWPNHLPPILYTPEKLVGFWQDRDRLEREEYRAETILNTLTRVG